MFRRQIALTSTFTPLSASSSLRHQSTRQVYSRSPLGLKHHNKKGSGSGQETPRWKTKHDGVDWDNYVPRSGKTNPHTFANAKVKHWHMWLMVAGCAVGGYFAGQYVSIDPKKLNPKDNNTGSRKVSKLDLSDAIAEGRDEERK